VFISIQVTLLISFNYLLKDLERKFIIYIVSNNDKTTTMDNLHNPKLLIEKHNVNCPYKTLSIPGNTVTFKNNNFYFTKKIINNFCFKRLFNRS
jgi:hypothetical protein